MIDKNYTDLDPHARILLGPGPGMADQRPEATSSVFISYSRKDLDFAIDKMTTVKKRLGI